jgi:hypothetical protein
MPVPEERASGGILGTALYSRLLSRAKMMLTLAKGRQSHGLRC